MTPDDGVHLHFSELRGVVAADAGTPPWDPWLPEVPGGGQKWPGHRGCSGWACSGWVRGHGRKHGHSEHSSGSGPHTPAGAASSPSRRHSSQSGQCVSGACHFTSGVQFLPPLAPADTHPIQDASASPLLTTHAPSLGFSAKESPASPRWGRGAAPRGLHMCGPHAHAHRLCPCRVSQPLDTPHT